MLVGFVSLDYTAYADGSGTAPDQPAFALGGFVSTELEWARFAREWAKVLADAKLPYFHMADFVQRSGGKLFKGWNQERKRHLIWTLAEVIARRAQFAFGFCVSKADFAAAVAETGGAVPPFVKRKPEHLWGPEPTCLLAAIDAVVDQTPAENPIAFIFDRDDASRMADYLITYEIGRILSNEPRRFGGVGFQDKREVLPLQAADFLANLLYRYKRLKGKRGLARLITWIIQYMPHQLIEITKDDLLASIRADKRPTR